MPLLCTSRNKRACGQSSKASILEPFHLSSATCCCQLSPAVASPCALCSGRMSRWQVSQPTSSFLYLMSLLYSLDAFQLKHARQIPSLAASIDQLLVD